MVHAHSLKDAMFDVRIYLARTLGEVCAQLTKLHPTTLYSGVRNPSQASYTLLNESHCELHLC